MASISGGVSTRHQLPFGMNIATNTKGGVTFLNKQGKDIQGNKHLTARQRHATLKDGFQKAKLKPSDVAHRNQAAAANAKARGTYANAARGGTITSYENRQIKSANRDAKIANQQVTVDNHRRELGQTKIRAGLDGKITPAESYQIKGAERRLGSAQAELSRLKTQDKRLDKQDARVLNNPFQKFKNTIDNATGNGRPVWRGPASMPKPCVCGRGIKMQHGPTSGRIGTHLAHDKGRLKFTDSRGRAADGTKYLNAGQRHAHMRAGANKAQVRGSDIAHKHQAAAANANLKATYANARADGFTSNFERRDINSARRDSNIANKQVSYDKQRQHVGHLEKRFAADGKFTPHEQRRLGQERGKLSSMGRELNNLRSQDRRADAADARVKSNPFAQFSNNMGVANHHAQQAFANWKPTPMPMPNFAAFASSITNAASAAASATLTSAAYISSSIVSGFASASFGGSIGFNTGFNAGYSAGFSAGFSASYQIA